MIDLHCPRCSTLLDEDLVAVVDGPNGIIGAAARHVPVERRHCVCGQFTWTRTSTITTVQQPQLQLIRGAA